MSFNSSCQINQSLKDSNDPKSDGNMVELGVWCSAFSLTSVLIATTNALTIKIFCTNAQLKKKKENVFLISLAIVDMLVGLLCVPLYVVLSIMMWHKNLYNSVYYIHLGTLFRLIDIFCGLSSIYTLTAIAIERLFAVIKPRVQRTISRKVYRYLVRVPWGVAFIFSVFNALSSYREFKVFEQFYNLIFASILLSLVIVIASYVYIWLSIKNDTQTKRLSATSLRNGKSDYQIKRERKMTRVVVIVTSTFVVTCLPFETINIAMFICECELNVTRSVYLITKLLQYSNSMLNPFIYSLAIAEFRKCLRKTVRSITRSTLIS